MPFGQLVIGPPGSGKSTYCDGMHQFMGAIGRKSAVVNLDPANDKTSYEPALDVRELITLDDIMENDELGPNGAVLYALEELENNFEWLEQGLLALKDSYILFDCPGQVELFTHHASLRNIFLKLQNMGYRLVALHLVDSYCLSLPTLYISTLLLSLRSMLQLDLPHLNVLTKIDNLASLGPLALPLSFYTEARSLEHLLPYLEAEQSGKALPSVDMPTAEEDLTVGDGEHPSTSTTDLESNPRFSALNRAIVELVEDYGLVGFETLAVEDKMSMTDLLHTIDRASGYAFGPSEGANQTIWEVAMREGGSGKMEVRDIEERWIDRRAEFDELERKAWEDEANASRNDFVARDSTEPDASPTGGVELQTGAHTGRKDPNP